MRDQHTDTGFDHINLNANLNREEFIMPTIQDTFPFAALDTPVEPLAMPTNELTGQAIELIEPTEVLPPDQPLPTFDAATRAATLSHANSQLITRHDLRNIPTPDATDTWHPVPFFELVESLTDTLATRGVYIDREQHAVNSTGLKLFSTFDLRYGTNRESTAALGLRSSNNKSMAIQIAVGTKVFVCDNMCFSGDLIALKRKHTSGLILANELNRGLDQYFIHQEQLTTNINRLKAKLLNDDEARRRIFEVFDTNALPVRLFRDVVDTWREMRDHNYISAWQLHNCLTLHAHKLPEQRKFLSTLALGVLFDI